MERRTSFLSGLVVAFKEKTYTDIRLKPNNGPCISAHKVVLAARSEVFKTMLSEDRTCKAPPRKDEIITLSDLNTEELQCFLEFLYTGKLTLDKLKSHVFALFAAADKYEIPYLLQTCERYIVNSLNASNVVDVLEMSEAHSNKVLKLECLNFIRRNMEGIVSSLDAQVWRFCFEESTSLSTDNKGVL